MVVIDSRPLLREGLGRLFAAVPGFDCVDCNSWLEEAPTTIQMYLPDIVVIGLGGDRRGVFKLVARLRRGTDDQRVVLIAGDIRDIDIRQALDLEVDGFVHESGGFDEVCRAIRAVHAGEHYYSPKVLKRIDPVEVKFKPIKSAKTRLDLLSPRERELLRILAVGKSLREACEELQISYKTADKQKVNLMKKLSIHDRVSLARFAIREEIVEA